MTCRSCPPPPLSAAESTRIRQVLDSLPTQLAKENKKFVYGAVRQGSRAKDFEMAIQWLMDAGIVHKVSRIREPKMPLKFYEDIDAFKLFLLDCGLLACMTDAPADQMLIGDNAFTEFKGAFTEQYVMQQLLVMESSRIIGAMPRLLPRSTLWCNTTIVWCRLRLRRRRMCALARWHNL